MLVRRSQRVLVPARGRATDASMADWSDGQYEQTATTLWTASEHAIARARITHGERILDLACGTGNASLLAARAGARVTGIDPAVRLLDVARQRLSSEGFEATFLEGAAGALPAETASFDAAVSVFGVIFAPDASAAVAELARVVRPGGRVVLTSWLPVGAIATAGRMVREAMAAVTPPSATPAPAVAPWGDPAFVRETFGAHGARVDVTEGTLAFTADSPALWFAEQEAHHPVWRLAHRLLAPHGDAWQSLRDRSVAALTEMNEDPSSFRVTSRYLIARADMAGG
ncbi:2-heptaprenyl-1,4-naphthoquinone methyltransferase [Minicystis rosea]|nr:2-heptaprenyl-1,4-naphthoquinone methyltransferase [Minicystis rosea]